MIILVIRFLINYLLQLVNGANVTYYPSNVFISPTYTTSHVSMPINLPSFYLTLRILLGFIVFPCSLILSYSYYKLLLLFNSILQARRMFRHRFQQSFLTRVLYDFLTFLTTRFIMAYTTFPFILLEFTVSFAFCDYLNI